ncbi:MAG: DUF436 family protein [Oscillospiraceae bacterium]|nr:DUF436 family protein [Oscillospiraceae bacterium]
MRTEQAVRIFCCISNAGKDIGGTLSGMHFRRVAVPVRTSLDHIGEAIVLCARTRPKYIGGPPGSLSGIKFKHIYKNT